MDKNTLLEILNDWNLWKKDLETGRERKEYLKQGVDFLKPNVILAIIGVRRAGKSYLMRQLAKRLVEDKKENILIVNFEYVRFTEFYPELLQEIYETYLEFLKPTSTPTIFLDEIHNVPKWEKFARYLSEAKKVQVFITGSSSKLLSEEYATLLSGRHVDMEIFPLSFKEFLSFKNVSVKTKLEVIKQEFRVKNLLKEFLNFGGFPKVVLTEEKEKKYILQSYFNDILIKDVQKRFGIREVGRLEELAKYYLSNISTLQSCNKTKNFIKLSLDTVERFSKYFEIARLLFFLPKFAFSLKEQVLTPKKVYSIDLGLRNLVGFKFSEDFGRLMENLVFLELFREGKEIYYWKDYKQREVDFVIKEGLKIKQLIQVCYSLENEETRKREIKSLIKASEELKCNNLLIISWDEEEEIKEKGKTIKVIPLWKWLLDENL